MILVNKRFHDLEEYAFSANSWNVDFRQLDCGSFSAYLLQVNLGNFHFLHTRFNRHIIQQGGSPPNLYTFGLPADSSQKIIWRGKELPKNSMMVFSPCMEMD